MRSLRIVMMMAVYAAFGCVGQQPFMQPAPIPRDERIEELVRTIDDNPVNLKIELTPSVRQLIEIGEPALPRMLDLMLSGGSDSVDTRKRATFVIKSIIEVKLGFIRDGWKKDEEREIAFWKSMPTLDAESLLIQRRYAVLRWRAWLAKQ